MLVTYSNANSACGLAEIGVTPESGWRDVLVMPGMLDVCHGILGVGGRSRTPNWPPWLWAVARYIFLHLVRSALRARCPVMSPKSVGCRGSVSVLDVGVQRLRPDDPGPLKPAQGTGDAYIGRS